jgi:hypothetical protein
MNLNQGRPKFFYLLFALVVLTILTSIRYQFQHGEGASQPDHLIAMTDGPSGTPLQIGAYIDNIYLSAQSTQTYDVDGWVWLRWPEKLEQERIKHHANPEQFLNFANRIDDFEFLLEPVYASVQQQQDGKYYQRFRFSGHFYVQHQDYRRYPFLTLTLPVVMELPELPWRRGSFPLTLTPDSEHSGLGQFIDLEGFITQGLQIDRYQHQYASTLGEETTLKPESRPQVHFVVKYQQSFSASFQKYFVPLIVVMVLSLMAPSLSASYWDARIGFPPTAILTLIFLQQETRADLPNLPYLTFIDMIYNTSYFANMLLFIAFVWASNTLHNAKDHDREATIAQIDRVDRRVQLALVSFMLLSAVGNWIGLWSRAQ